MRKLIISIEVGNGNDAFEPENRKYEVLRLVGEAMNRIAKTEGAWDKVPAWSEPLYDSNGNRAGSINLQDYLEFTGGEGRRRKRRE